MTSSSTVAPSLYSHYKRLIRLLPVSPGTSRHRRWAPRAPPPFLYPTGKRDSAYTVDSHPQIRGDPLSNSQQKAGGTSVN
ncbi:hypothetical protein AVEN_95545-1 [Araneus ventricosus]|uniref:Uncharacterized protein n=1 Tax=Araneus ventricosus TaxID=182803 RepID=A0A4Y2HB92_ARAVE|nr:hypothetical protein AVEN_95545-1 [Araneus ventricosus]